jgi:ariadne-1
MEESAAAFGVLETDMDFLKEAYRQVAECRRMLRWTYAFGFFVEEQAKLELFQMLQTDAETSLERLHGCAEKERVDIVATVYSDSGGELVPQGPAPEHYAKYREKLSRLTMVTRDHFENLSRAFRDGLSEVDTTAAAANAAKAAEKAAERADPVASTRFLFTQEDEDY